MNPNEKIYVSITFRLSALSALIINKYRKEHAAMMVSITFRLSALSALYRRDPTAEELEDKSLNYLSAQCPFGTDAPAVGKDREPDRVSITFRLSALSARQLDI